MIKVNLQQRKAAVGAGASGGLGGLLGAMDKLRGGPGAGDADKRSLLTLGAAYLAVLGAASWYTGTLKTGMLAQVDAEIAKVDSKMNLLTSELNKTNGYEQIKKSLEADEKTIRTKIGTIQELIRDRSTPPKILTTLSETIPKEVWLREFSLKDRHFRIGGSSTSMDVVSDFMKALEETIYFKGVVLRSSRQENAKGRASVVFELEADRR